MVHSMLPSACAATGFACVSTATGAWLAAHSPISWHTVVGSWFDSRYWMMSGRYWATSASHVLLMGPKMAHTSFSNSCTISVSVLLLAK